MGVSFSCWKSIQTQTRAEWIRTRLPWLSRSRLSSWCLTHVGSGTHIGSMPTVIRPATVAFDPSGTPFSEKFADVYHSAESGPDQARNVFLHGSDLPSRWARKRVFTIVETGFGLG